MIAMPPDISQKELKPLLKERFENPEVYADRPLVLWRSYFPDMVAQAVIKEVQREYNRNKSKSETKGVINANPKTARREHLGFCAIDTMEDFHTTLQNYAGLPMVVFACLPERDADLIQEFPNAEEYMFVPDFKQWKESTADYDACQLVAEFVESGSSTPEDISYRWYNYFNNPHISRRKGCDFPGKWLDGLYKVSKYAKMRGLPGLFAIPVDKFRSFFTPGISTDLIDEFHAFVTENRDRL